VTRRRATLALLGALLLAAAGCDRQAAPGAASASGEPTEEDRALPPDQTGGFDGAAAFAHVARQVSFGPRWPGSEGHARVQEYIRAQLQAFGCEVEEEIFTAQTPLGRVEMRNVVAKIPGRRDDALLLLTHYDTLRREGFVGANDGGSSTGLMLEMARLL
jgi:glutaminyl-peptide cyclotransferase